MVQRIRRERGSGSDFLDLKTGSGGIIEAEFLVQALQMRANIWEPNWERAVDALHRSRYLDKSDVARLKSSYAFLRRCELVLRRYDNRSVSTLPGDPDEQRKFAIRLGYNDFDVFPARLPHCSRGDSRNLRTANYAGLIAVTINVRPSNRSGEFIARTAQAFRSSSVP